MEVCKQGRGRVHTTENQALALLPCTGVQQFHRHPLRARQEALVSRSRLLCRMRAADRAQRRIRTSSRLQR